LFFEKEALKHGQGQWISEAEGEKCAAWLRAGQLVAVSQPGHDHKVDSITMRYKKLKEAGVLGIAYLADADATGTRKAQQCASAALAVGLLFKIAQAQDVWPADMVSGGSIDDAPGTAAERVAKFEACFHATELHKASCETEGREKPSMRFRELLNAMLDALIAGDDDNLMEMRADAITRFRRTDSQVEATLFDLHRLRQLPCKASQQPESLDLSRISGMDWLIEGFVPDNDMTLIWGDAGSGKTTAALGAARAVLLGTGLLDYSQPTPKRPVLFIASDSGASPLYAAMQDMGLADLPEVMQGPDQRLFVWASDANQGMTAWAADLRGCIRLLDFIRQKRIGLVIIDSCKAVCTPSSGLDYTSNQMVTALLTYFKEVICPHAAVVWLNHDGTAAGAHAGAKAWKEIPSMVHRIRREERKDGAKANNRRRWDVTKSRMGPTREFFYQFSNGTLEICSEQEVVGNCLAQVVDVLTKAWQGQGKESLSRSELTGLICVAGGPSTSTLDNTLSSAARAKNPEICRVSGKRGHYKLAPRVAGALKGCMRKGKEQGESPLSDYDLDTSRLSPVGTSVASGPEPFKFPVGIGGKSADPREGKGFESFPSLMPLTPHGVSGALSPPMGSGADAFDSEDDPAWGPRP
jgi:archaellum biogenesis ATPase FlaH